VPKGGFIDVATTLKDQAILISITLLDVDPANWRLRLRLSGINRRLAVSDSKREEINSGLVHRTDNHSRR